MFHMKFITSIRYANAFRTIQYNFLQFQFQTIVERFVLGLCVVTQIIEVTQRRNLERFVASKLLMGGVFEPVNIFIVKQMMLFLLSVTWSPSRHPKKMNGSATHSFLTTTMKGGLHTTSAIMFVMPPWWLTHIAKKRMSQPTSACWRKATLSSLRHEDQSKEAKCLLLTMGLITTTNCSWKERKLSCDGKRLWKHDATSRTTTRVQSAEKAATADFDWRTTTNATRKPDSSVVIRSNLK